ncbi:hypothetical protein M378DRAFT_92026 [Amanita muscaria Koide BX008]|uniref:Trimethylguanosine synthase n=1 Tax=Amanita muscaria (strain Koide BX008) TaxID=946122 RepID=A0A0C2W0S7_AMAMK|nr:hypothetical protein M378DRAFT_92026 [Amanita muscaria Koide BX008]
MGKKRKHGGFTGLSGFISKAFENPVIQAFDGGDFTKTAKAAGDAEAVKPAAIVSENTTTITTVHNVRSPTPLSKKKRKLVETHRNERWVEKYDATSLVPHYGDLTQVPGHLQKYFNQRTSYFSLYSTPPGCLLDEEGWYSITPEVIASHIAERCRCDTIVDAFCGVGGNTIAFAQTCQRVIAIDNNPTRLSLARHNAQIYGVADRIEFILADYISFAKSYTASQQQHSSPSSSNSNLTRKIDVVFLSPPWGGPSYLSGWSDTPTKGDDDNGNGNGKGQGQGYQPYSLSSMKPIHGAELFELSRKVTKNVAYYLPRNTRMEEVSVLVRGSSEKVEVEEAWTGSKLKAITCYFGGLVGGQEDMF